MKKRAVSLPVNTLIVIIIALIVLAVILFFFATTTGKQIFPAITEKIKMALGLLNASSSQLP